MTGSIYFSKHGMLKLVIFHTMRRLNMAKKTFSFLILTFFFLMLTSCAGGRVTTARPMVNHVIHPNIDQIIGFSTHIVQAEIINSRTAPINIAAGSDRYSNPHYWIYTAYSLRVTSVYMGDVTEGDTVEAMQLGGRYRNRELIVNNIYTPLSQGDELIFFLRYPHEQWRPMFITSSIQGIFYPAQPNASGDTVLETVGPHYRFHLELTVNDLERIAEGTFVPRPMQTPSLDTSLDNLHPTITETESCNQYSYTP